jgi:hypothetical protein
MGGQAIPVGEPDSARAAQFELVVAASCRTAGADPMFSEPNINPMAAACPPEAPFPLPRMPGAAPLLPRTPSTPTTPAHGPSEGGVDVLQLRHALPIEPHHARRIPVLGAGILLVEGREARPHRSPRLVLLRRVDDARYRSAPVLEGNAGDGVAPLLSSAADRLQGPPSPTPGRTGMFQPGGAEQWAAFVRTRRRTTATRRLQHAKVRHQHPPRREETRRVLTSPKPRSSKSCGQARKAGENL